MRKVLGIPINEKTYVCQVTGSPAWFGRVGASGDVHTRVAEADLGRAVFIEESHLVRTSDIQNLMTFNDFKLRREIGRIQPSRTQSSMSKNKTTPKPRTIRIDEDVWQLLAENAKPLVDSPNSVLRHLLGLDNET